MPRAAPAWGACADAVTLTTGSNTITWSAVGREYLPLTPSCTLSYDVDGPDVVLSYTPASSGTLSWSMPKPSSTRWVALVSTGACGTLTPQITCTSDFSATALSGSFTVTAGTTYWWYVADTVSGANPLSNPLTVDLTLTP